MEFSKGMYHVSVKGPVAMVMDKEVTASPQPTITHKYSLWGKNNLWPQDLLKSLDDVSLVTAVLDWKSRALYSGGIVYGYATYDDNGVEIFKPIFDKEIERWLENTDINRYLIDACTYFYYFYNIFPEIILSKDKKTITKIYCQETTDVRLGLMVDGIISTAHLSARWHETVNLEDKTKIKKVPILNIGSNWIEKTKKGTKRNYILPISYSSPGRHYYQRPPWESLINSSWLDIAKKIPSFKKAILENQISVKYLIRVPEWWWESTFPDFKSKDEAQQKKIKNDVHNDFNTFLSGIENAGKSMMVITKNDFTDTKYAQWEITAIDNKMKEGMYIEDSQEADAHIFKNLAVDPTLFGSGPGKNNESSGSGSDKRVAWNMYILQQKAIQDLILKPLNLIARYNGWTERLSEENQQGRFEFRFKTSLIATLDAGETKTNT